jgi:hypothetical protein
VKTHAHPYGLPTGPIVLRMCALDVDRGRNGVARTGERKEERVALLVDLNALLAPEGVTNDPAVIGDQLGVTLAEPL